MPNNVKTYDESDDPEDHLKIFQAATKVECWAMPTWCHMFNSTLTGFARVWFDDLPPESVDSYDDLKKAFLANYFQQKKCIRDPVEIHHIKQRKGESMEDFVQRLKGESMHVKGAPECMRIFGFMHEINNPELIKRLHDNIPKSVDKMMREVGRKQNFDRRYDFRNQQRSKRRRDKFTLLTKSPKEILALDKGKFKASPPMTTPVEKRNINKFCEFHGEVGHNTDECMQIKELIKNRKLLHVIKELKQGSGKDQPKTEKKGETSGKDNPLAILMAPAGSKNPNGSSYRTPHRLQWRNNTVHGTSIAPGKNRICGSFHLYMDEFCGSKITVSVQWDHRKANSKEDSSSPINSSRNAKIPSLRRDTHSLK
ncbi:reverse transcriptase domain-containing protein [Tanacetum coccineum]